MASSCWNLLTRKVTWSKVKQLLKDGVNVGIGVDGSASNDAGNMLAEARLTCLLQRAGGDVSGVGCLFFLLIPYKCYFQRCLCSCEMHVVPLIMLLLLLQMALCLRVCNANSDAAVLYDRRAALALADLSCHCAGMHCSNVGQASAALRHQGWREEPGASRHWGAGPRIRRRFRGVSNGLPGLCGRTA